MVGSNAGFASGTRTLASRGYDYPKFTVNNNNRSGLLSLTMESKDYEKHSDTIIIPPVHVALRCDNRLPIWEQ
jgi:hypothetical protein